MTEPARQDRQERETRRETQRALSLRERFEYELDELERSLARMRATADDLPRDRWEPEPPQEGP